MARRVRRALSVTAGTGLLILGIAGTQAKAATVDLSGDTSSPATPTWNRPETNDATPNTPPTTLSGVTVPYAILPFSVDTSGNYDFLSTSNTFNNYTFLYRNSVDPSQPLASNSNFIIANDNFQSSQRQSGFSNVPLTAGTQYLFIVTGNTSNDRGSFGSSISGPGTAVIPVTAAPVPFEFSPTLGLSILGAWFGLSHLKTRIGKHKTIQESQDQAL